jgi:hypothetical protein
MRVLMAIVVTFGLAGAAGAEETKLGSGITLESATPIASLTKTPEEFVGKTVRIDGVATAVCTQMGCWMAVAPADNAGGPTVRLKVEDDVIVFPVSAKGKQVSAQGVFEPVGSDAHAKDAAGEHAKHDGKASREYHIKATGAVIR